MARRPVEHQWLAGTGADFAAGPQTRLLATKVVRVPGNPLIKDKFWLDDVKIIPVAAKAITSRCELAPVGAALLINGTLGRVVSFDLVTQSG